MSDVALHLNELVAQEMGRAFITPQRLQRLWDKIRRRAIELPMMVGGIGMIHTAQ